MTIQWINENKGGPRDEAGHWRSADGRFSIAANYRHTVYPDSYTVRDCAQQESAKFDRVRDCKAWAAERAGRAS
jgi:hypothetical protein